VGRVVVLEDPAFGETKRGTLLKPTALCNPAEIDEGSAPTGAPSLACYRLRDAEPGFRRRRLEVVSRFGRETLTVYRPESLCAPGTPEGTLPVPGFDHFKCYKVKAGNSSRDEVLVHDGVFAGPETTHVRGRASAICNAVGKDGEEIEEPTAHLACYDIHDAREQSGFQGRRYLGFQGPFGEENLHVLKPQRLCVSSKLSELGARDLSGSDTVMDLELEFDGLGRLVQQTGLLPDAAIGRAFSYDGLGRLKTALGKWEKARELSNPVAWTFRYDPLGNLRSQSSTGTYSRAWSYDHPTKPSFLTRFSDPQETQDMAADPGGNVAQRNGERFSWNAQNRLHRISGRSSSSSYDAFARRVLQSSDGTEIIYVGSDFEYNATLGRAHKFFFAGGQRIASLTTSYAPDPLQLPRPSRVASFMAYVPDHLGSIRAVINQDGGIIATRDYGPFGRTISRSGGLELEYGFTGQVRDPGTGLYHYGARMYDPRWGRFISPDERVQLIDPQGLNPYSYVLNRPTSLIDPTGEMAWIPAMLVVGATSAIAASAIGLLAPDQPGFQALQSALIGIAGLAATFGLAPAVAVTPTIGAIVELGSAATCVVARTSIAAWFPTCRTPSRSRCSKAIPRSSAGPSLA
jgi:RHS repeat-associated protein